MTERHEKLTARSLIRMKSKGQKIAMITAYDFPTARLADDAGVDSILVGDSAAMVVLGYPDTRFVGIDEMITFCRAVTRAVRRALVIGDMPFMSYHVSHEDAVRNAGRFVKEGGVDAVKVEGGRHYADVVRSIVRAGIPVMGHVGMTPQFFVTSVGYRLRGKKVEDAEEVIKDAEEIARAGAFSIVLEFAVSEVAEYLSSTLEIPVIGIGAGPKCDGQVLVLHDVVGLYEKSPPFAKRYADVGTAILNAIKSYVEDVKADSFPGPEHTQFMDSAEREELRKRVGR
ncbi:MAG: 3-methyl-2-oxobutanoate hydroxymethyltransferase [Thaumarchaeota archaeon]|nr:3-methyl-2-oxobutanoate hydroxymethyltransferase [Candidatus Calditenuaceae archaeon]MDW8186593.1 3-methyl-2-oxobutanoate hydroxymethyltransferase [Nitrososphaerota archaeon]